MRLKGIALGLTIVALMISIVPAPAQACAYTPGYWKHNVTVYYEERRDNSYAADDFGVKESDASMEAYEAWLQNNGYPGFTLAGAYADFWLRGPGVQVRRQELADMLNLAKAAVG